MVDVVKDSKLNVELRGMKCSIIFPLFFPNLYFYIAYHFMGTMRLYASRVGHDVVQSASMVKPLDDKYPRSPLI